MSKKDNMAPTISYFNQMITLHPEIDDILDETKKNLNSLELLRRKTAENKKKSKEEKKAIYNDIEMKREVIIEDFKKILFNYKEQPNIRIYYGICKFRKYLRKYYGC